MRRLPVALALLVAACNSPPPPMKDAGPPDLAPVRPPDLAMPDLTMPPDLAMPDLAKLEGPCAGTMLAHTCVDEFFARVMLCFPVSGACTYSMGQSMVYSTCWENGSKRLSTGTQGQIQTNWSSGGRTCMIANQVNTGWIFFANNQMMSLDQSERFTCPNGVTMKVAKGACPALDAMLGLGGAPQGCTSVMGPGC